ncbi:PREDICTED: urokinase-type plasminogen activator [Calidris pugnax]|uniref:urokinase-type plasminogen activator n=1 Tax=Calidris pugnax TaxID=198806 RepID=UPI00071D6875|nr:PREDICTED: urokinase-type plasminogen activator [Calidris pugnax]
MQLLIFLIVTLGTLVTGLDAVYSRKSYKLPYKYSSPHKGKYLPLLLAPKKFVTLRLHLHVRRKTLTDCRCLNGGTCITYYFTSGINRCVCPKGYFGIHCEIDTASTCYTGNGEDYRGIATEDDCLPWDLPSVVRRGRYHARLSNALQLGLGKHNYCRNPNGSSRPWCYTKNGFAIQETACNIEKCGPACGQRSMSKYFKIVGGSQAEVETQPWIAGIFENMWGMDRFLCGGSLIDPCWVLTAAHCFNMPSKRPLNKSIYKVFLGKSILNVTDMNEQVFMVDDIISHPGFTDVTGGNENDIALIRIRSASGQCAVESKYVRTVCLPERNLNLRDNTRCEIAGYGKQDFYTASTCYTGNGEDYRGIATEDDCLPWDLPSVVRRGRYHARLSNALQLGLGKHNYCRNPNGSSRPWCYTKNGFAIQETACNIEKCGPACGQRSMSKYFKIVGGSQAEVETQPWIAGIFENMWGMDRFLCGGSLIDPCWVLTAAHCFNMPSKRPLNKSIYKVFLGKSILNVTDMNEQVFMVDDIISHPGFTDVTGGNENDIALIRIRSASGQCAVESKYVRTVCLPERNLNLRDNTRCEIAGYGKQDFYDIYYAQRLMSATVNLISQQKCKYEYYDDTKVTDNMVCAGDPTWMTDACKGDSGGPMVCEHKGRMTLYGIVSWGDGCAKKNKPGVYTRVTRYLDWIDSNMNAVTAKSRFLPEPK